MERYSESATTNLSQFIRPMCLGYVEKKNLYQAFVFRETYRRDNSAEPLKRNFHILAAVAQIGIFRILKLDLILEDIKSTREFYHNVN